MSVPSRAEFAEQQVFQTTPLRRICIGRRLNLNRTLESGSGIKKTKAASNPKRIIETIKFKQVLHMQRGSSEEERALHSESSIGVHGGALPFHA
jgi:hypothetical protein